MDLLQSILNNMVNYSTLELDNIFGALANRQRREILTMLKAGVKSISELALPLKLSLPAIHKHIKVLERAKLISSSKNGRVHEVTIVPTALTSAEEWIEFHKSYWNSQLDSLGNYIDNKGAKNG